MVLQVGKHLVDVFHRSTGRKDLNASSNETGVVVTSEYVPKLAKSDEPERKYLTQSLFVECQRSSGLGSRGSRHRVRRVPTTLAQISA